jgi:branched-chain amino acid transport system permease protein
MSKVSNRAIVIALAVFAALLAAPYMGLAVHWQSLAYLFFYWIVLATSWNILSGYSGYFSFGHGAFFGLGVYAMASLTAKLEWPTVPSALLSGVLAALFALCVGSIVFRAKNIRGESFALITLALGFVLSTIAVNTSIDGGAGVYLMSVPLPEWGPDPASTFYYSSLLLAVISLGVARFIFFSPLGLALLAIHDDEDAAQVNGVPAFKLKMLAFAISSFFAGVIGAIHAMYVSYVTVGEIFNITVPLTVVLMSILGGTRHWAGPLVGAIIITALMNSFTAGDSALIGKVVIGMVLAISVLTMPRGILGTWQFRQHKNKLKRNGNQSHTDDVKDELQAKQGDGETFTPVAQRRTAAGGGHKILQVEGLSKHFSGLKALDNASVDLYEGEILGLLGPNGSGKSTFINVITGHYKATTGKVLLNNVDCCGMPAHKIRRLGISRTYQIPRPFSGLTVAQNIAISAHFGGEKMTTQQALQEARQWMEFTGLEEKADHYPDEINLHQRKFLELARALAARPKILLLDEVLSGLTPVEIGSAVQTIKRIRERGTSIIFVEHVMSAVLALSDRLVVLNHGQVIAEGQPEDVMSRPEIVEAYLGRE